MSGHGTQSPLTFAHGHADADVIVRIVGGVDDRGDCEFSNSPPNTRTDRWGPDPGRSQRDCASACVRVALKTAR